MIISDNNKISFCKESNKLVGAANFLAWKKRTNLNLIENEVMDHIKGSITQPPKEDTQAHARFMKGEVRAQRILIESIKDSLIPYVSKLETAKAIYDKLVELFSVIFRRSNFIKARTLQTKDIQGRWNSLILYEDIRNSRSTTRGGRIHV